MDCRTEEDGETGASPPTLEIVSTKCIWSPAATDCHFFAGSVPQIFLNVLAVFKRCREGKG